MSVKFEDVPVGAKFGIFEATPDNHWIKVSSRTGRVVYDGEERGVFYFGKNERVVIMLVS